MPSGLRGGPDPLQRSRRHGVSGLEAAENLLAIARTRVPTGDFRTGELQELPFADGTFDVVAGFNSFQYAASPGAALAEAPRRWRRSDKPTEAIASARRFGVCSPTPERALRHQHQGGEMTRAD